MKKLIAIDDVEIGMETASAITNKYGQVLLKQNTRIIESHIKIFKTWGVTTIEIICNDEDNIAEALDPEVKKKIEKVYYSKIDWKPRNVFEDDLLEMGLRKKIEYYFENNSKVK